jgi:hypothetical protein
MRLLLAPILALFARGHMMKDAAITMQEPEMATFVSL